MAVRSVPFIFIFYLYWNFILCSVNRKFSFPWCSCVHCVIYSTHPRVLFALPIWLPWSPSCSRVCQKLFWPPLGLKISASWSMLHTLEMPKLNLFIYYSVETVKFLHMCISGLSKLIFHSLRARISCENCHFHLWSTTSGPHFDLHDTRSLCHVTQRMS